MKNNNLYNDLIKAIEQSDEALIKQYIDNNGNSLLYHAIAVGNLEVIQLLISKVRELKFIMLIIIKILR